MAFGGGQGRDRRAVRLGCGLELGQADPHGGVAAVGADRAVERRHRSLRACARELGDEVGGAAQVGGGPAGIGGGQRALRAFGQQPLAEGHRLERQAREMARAVIGPRLPGPVGRRQVERLPGRVEQDGADVDRGDAVDQGVVHLGQQGDALATGDALDDGELPQRARAVQATRQLVADELGQLVRAAGCRQGGAAHVPAQVELVVVDPDRVRHPGRGRLQALAVARDQVQAPVDSLEHPRVFEAGPGLEHEHAAHAHRHRSLLGGERGAIGG